MLLVITPFIPLTLRGMVKEVPIYRDGAISSIKS